MSDDPIGYVVDRGGDHVTICADCEEEWNDIAGRDPILENEVYGDQVPYPECFKCGEVIRP